MAERCTAVEYLSPAVVAEMGRVSGEVSAALADLPAMSADRVLQWDLRQGPRVIEFLADHIADAELRERMTSVTRGEARRVERVAPLLPVQVVHGDLTDDNLMRSVTRSTRDCWTALSTCARSAPDDDGHELRHGVRDDERGRRGARSSRTGRSVSVDSVA